MVDELRNLIGREYGPAFNQDQMQAYPQVRQTPCTLARVRRGRARNHQARRAENTAPVRNLDRLIDLVGQAVIIGGYGQVARPALRWMRNMSSVFQA